MMCAGCGAVPDAYRPAGHVYTATRPLCALRFVPRFLMRALGSTTASLNPIQQVQPTALARHQIRRERKRTSSLSSGSVTTTALVSPSHMQPSAEKNLSAARGAFQIGGQEPISSERGHRAATSSAPRTRLCSVLFERWCEQRAGRGIHQHQLHPPRVGSCGCSACKLVCFSGAQLGPKAPNSPGKLQAKGWGASRNCM